MILSSWCPLSPRIVPSSGPLCYVGRDSTSRSLLKSWFTRQDAHCSHRDPTFLLKASFPLRSHSLLEMDVGMAHLIFFLQSTFSNHVSWQYAKNLPLQRFGTQAIVFVDVLWIMTWCSWGCVLEVGAIRDFSKVEQGFPPFRWFKVSRHRSLKLVGNYISSKR